MAKVPVAPPPLSRRIDIALSEGRVAQALDLAKQNARQDTGPVAQALVRRCYLAAAAFHVGRDAFRDAHALLTEAESVPFADNPWWEKLAEYRADLGDWTRALKLLDQAPGSAARPVVLGRIVDRAMKEPGEGGKQFLPADLHAPFAAVKLAFAEYEKGQDEKARDALGGVGLASPFLEWKLFLRGLMAWSANDDARAAENWVRLATERLPAKLAAPFRFATDKAFAAALPADKAAIVAKQADNLTGGVGDGLRRLRKQLAIVEMFPDALETAKAIVPDLKRVAPEIVPKLANVFYWALLAHGQPEDMPKYGRIFGAHPDDPQYYRLQALVMEQVRRLDGAHAFWAKYEEWVASHPERWPGAQDNRARAMILERMGRLAQEWLEEEEDPEDEMEDFFSMLAARKPKKRGPRKPLSLSAEMCFRRASDLAPDWVTPATHLLKEYARAKKTTEAKAVAQRLLERFPTDLGTLEAAATLYESLGEAGPERECLKRALATNPLDRRLRARVASSSIGVARGHAAQGNFSEALATLKEAGDMGGAELAPAVLALSVATEVRAGREAEAAKHRAALLALPAGRPAAMYRQMVELSRLNVPKKAITPYQNGFIDSLQADMSVAELSGLIDALDQYLKEATPYWGMKTHQKKILDCLAQAAAAAGAENDFVQLGLTLHRLKMWKLLKEVGDKSARRFPHNPYFNFFSAESLVSRQRDGNVSQAAGHLYRLVKQGIDAAKDDRFRRLQEMFDERRKLSPDVEMWLNERQSMFFW